MKITSRAIARTEGQKQYFTGKACPHGHVAPRWTSTGSCTACTKHKGDEWRESGKMAEWRKTNRERLLAQQKGYRDDRKEARAARMQDYYAAHREERLAYQKQYLQENRADVYARLHKRRARKLNATPARYGELDDFALIEAADLCARRKQLTGAEWHIDHMLPLQARNVCGLHWYANLQVIPQRLNAARVTA